MNSKQAAVVCLLLAGILANLPFFRQRWLAFPGVNRYVGPNLIRLVQWLAMYAVWMALVTALEMQVGMLTAKGWQIWTISIAFFAVLAFPGITYRYLWKTGRDD